MVRVCQDSRLKTRTSRLFCQAGIAAEVSSEHVLFSPSLISYTSFLFVMDQITLIMCLPRARTAWLWLFPSALSCLTCCSWGTSRTSCKASLEGESTSCILASSAIFLALDDTDKRRERHFRSSHLGLSSSDGSQEPHSRLVYYYFIGLKGLPFI